jgi:hypothetical protein
MSNYEDILESYWECKFQVDQVFGKELEESIVIHSRVPNELSLSRFTRLLLFGVSLLVFVLESTTAST